MAAGAWRVVVEGKEGLRREFWLGCSWDGAAAAANLPLSCQNWLRQYVVDMAALFGGVLGLDYRLAYGTAVGALRSCVKAGRRVGEG